MSAIYTYTLDQDFFTLILSDYLREVAGPIMGANQKQTAIKEAEREAIKKMAGISLAAYANDLRIKQYESLNLDQSEGNRWWIPGTSTYEASQWLRKLELDWKEGVWDTKTDDEFMRDARTSFHLSVVYTDDYLKAYNEVRKSAVKAGWIEPTESDREWIEEEYQAYKSLADPLLDLRDKLKNPKG